MSKLSFDTLRAANMMRLPLFKNAKGEPAHTHPTGADWDLSDWMTAIAGELGETANILKKVRRGDFPLEQAQGMLADELSDVVIYADITALQIGMAFSNGLPDFATLREYTAQKPPTRTLNQLMTCAVAAFGICADQIANLGSKPMGPRVREITSNNLALGLVTIDHIASSAGIALGEAVMKKFNETSLKVGAGIYIGEPDIVINEDGLTIFSMGAAASPVGTKVIQ